MANHVNSPRGAVEALTYYYDINLLAWVAGTQPGSVAGGGIGDASAANQTTEIARLTAINNKITAVDTGAVTVASSALPTGASTSAKQDTGNTSLSSIDTHVDVALSTRLKPADTLTKVSTVDTITNVVHIDDNLGSLTVDGVFFQATQPVSLAALPALVAGSAVIGHVIVDTAPTTAVTNANLDVALSTRTKPSDQQHVIIDSSATLTVTGGLTDTQLRATAVPVTANAGTNLNTSALALEAGHLATIDSHIPALGQALAAASIPVVLPAATITTLTPPAAIVGFALDSTVAKDASITSTNAKLDTLHTDFSITQPRSISNFPATQAVTIASGSAPDVAAILAIYNNLVVALLTDIRTELRVLNTVGSIGLNVKDDLDALRADPSVLN